MERLSAPYVLTLFEEDDTQTDDKKTHVQNHIISVIKRLKTQSIDPDAAHKSIAQVIHYHNLSALQLNGILQYLHENPLELGQLSDEDRLRLEQRGGQDQEQENTEILADSGEDIEEAHALQRSWWTPERKATGKTIAKGIGKGLLVAGAAYGTYHGAGHFFGAADVGKRTASIVSAAIVNSTLNAPKTAPQQTTGSTHATLHVGDHRKDI